MQHRIDVERIELATAVAVDGFSDPGNEFAQLDLVVGRDVGARRAPI